MDDCGAFSKILLVLKKNMEYIYIYIYIYIYYIILKKILLHITIVVFLHDPGSHLIWPQGEKIIYILRSEKNYLQQNKNKRSFLQKNKNK